MDTNKKNGDGYVQISTGKYARWYGFFTLCPQPIVYTMPEWFFEELIPHHTQKSCKIYYEKGRDHQ